MLADITSQIEAEDAILMGRVTYQEFASFWPTATDEPFASHINKTPKYVVSTTLEKAEWGRWDEPKLIKDVIAESYFEFVVVTHEFAVVVLVGEGLII